MRVLNVLPTKKDGYLDDLNDLTDETLMTMYQNGNEHAFRKLYGRHSSKIYSFLKKRVQTEEQVQEIYQDVFIKIHSSKHLYNKTLPLLPWLFTITRSVMIDFFRKNKNTRKIMDTFDLNSLPAPTEDVLAGSTQLLTDQLPPSQRIAVQMRYIDDSTFEEIAERLKTTPTNVRQIISRGIKRLKQFIEDKEPS